MRKPKQDRLHFIKNWSFYWISETKICVTLFARDKDFLNVNVFVLLAWILCNIYFVIYIPLSDGPHYSVVYYNSWFNSIDGWGVGSLEMDDFSTQCPFTFTKFWVQVITTCSLKISVFPHPISLSCSLEGAITKLANIVKKMNLAIFACSYRDTLYKVLSSAEEWYIR